MERGLPASAAVPSAPADGAPARVFLGKYRSVRLLGEGGMGRVYLARQLDTDGEVAVKVLHERVSARPGFRDRFRIETLLMARFQHPHATALLDAGDDPQGPCIVMEYVPGVSLDRLLRIHRRLRPQRVGRLLRQLCLALYAAHAAGIVHRDLKPDNLMVTAPNTPEESLKVMDFGLAMLTTEVYIPKERLNDPARCFSASGTPPYICPEMIRGDEVDLRGDLYSVGVVLFELLTGKLPFDRGTVQLTLQAHQSDPIPTFAEKGASDVPPAVEAVVRACLAKFPNERPQSARELCERFDRALGRKLVGGGPWMNGSKEVVRSALPADPAAASPAPGAIVHVLEAWMPEKIAVIKLKGFVQDAGGEVYESLPGLIRVRFDDRLDVPPPPASLLDRLGLGRRKPEPVVRRTEVDLRMQKQEAGRLRITVVLRPGGGAAQAADPTWRQRCEEIHRDLRAYLLIR